MFIVLLQGVGAASVEYLVHSPMIRQSHFQRVILMSGRDHVVMSQEMSNQELDHT